MRRYGQIWADAGRYGEMCPMPYHALPCPEVLTLPLTLTLTLTLPLTLPLTYLPRPALPGGGRDGEPRVLA